MRSSRPLHVILASTSPRRADLMSRARIPVEIHSPSADEERRRGERPDRMVARLARDKAESVVSAGLEKHEIILVIGSDTIVVAPDNRTVLGKPRDKKEARRMLGMLAGHTHTVLTGYSIVFAARGAQSQAITRVVRSRVNIRAMDRGSIRAYVETGEPMDKAGAYAAQGLGSVLIESISGSYTNVVGLPMAQLLADLEEKFGITPFSGTRPARKRKANNEML